MKDLLEALFKFGTEFTWRKLTILILAFALTFVLFLVYERYTSSFRFSRLQKASDLLVRVQEIEQRGTNSSPELLRARKALVSEAVKAIEEQPFSLEFIPSRLTFSMESVWKFLAGAALLWTLAIFQIKQFRKAPRNSPLMGLLLLGAVSGFLGVFVTPVAWPWFHILVFPWLASLGIAVVTIPGAFLISRFPPIRAKAKARKCLQNLIQLDGAAQQWALENKKGREAVPNFDDLIPYLKDGVVPRCPGGGRYALRSVADAPLCTQEGHSL